MMKTLDDVLRLATACPPVEVAVAGALDDRMVDCFVEAHRLGVASGVFFVPPGGLSLPPPKEAGTVVPCASEEEASELAVKAVRSGACAIVMKGIAHTDTFLRAVLNKEYGLVRNRLISNVFVYGKPGAGLCLITDPSINIAPTLEQKVQLIENAVEVARDLGMQRPRVAVLCAVETVSSKMPETIEAAALSKMAERGQIKDCIVDGPLALDNALSLEAVRIKGIQSQVAGQADVLLCQHITEANILTKALPLFAGVELAANVVGTTHPVIIVSRADSARTRLLSICLSKIRRM